MAKKTTRQETPKTQEKASAEPNLKKDCRTCDNTGQVRVSRARGRGRSPSQLQYDIVTERCPDC